MALVVSVPFLSVPGSSGVVIPGVPRPPGVCYWAEFTQVLFWGLSESRGSGHGLQEGNSNGG